MALNFIAKWCNIYDKVDQILQPPGHRTKVNADNKFRGHPGRPLNVLRTFNIRLISIRKW